MYKNFFKRLFDIIGALSAIPFVLLISLFVGLAIYIEDRGDIFYLDPRITKVGRFIRKTSIDELPQFFNVLIGDMSFIGPRPVTTDRPLEEYDEKRKIRLEVRPGITGYSQAYFRNSISNEEKLEKDAFYARNVTFGGDLKIIFATVNTVVFRKNIYNKKNR